MARILDFMEDLKDGNLKPILERVKADNTLDLQIRDNYINIYYRGGNLLKIEPKKKKEPFHFDEKYLKSDSKHNKELKRKIDKARQEGNVEDWIELFPELKQSMDFYMTKKRNSEREYQQHVVRENNYSKIANSTDYFIIDSEYQYKNRFDLIAVRWESDRAIRKIPKGFKPKLVFIEAKYGDSALKGKAGMLKHIEDFIKLDSKKIESIKNEMLTVLKQKRELGLIHGLGKDKNKNEFPSFSESTDLIFLLINHDPASKNLDDVLKEIEEYDDKTKDRIKFCSSNFFGYGLYKENIFTLSEFRERFYKQILNKK